MLVPPAAQVRALGRSRILDRRVLLRALREAVAVAGAVAVARARARLMHRDVLWPSDPIASFSGFWSNGRAAFHLFSLGLAQSAVLVRTLYQRVPACMVLVPLRPFVAASHHEIRLNIELGVLLRCMAVSLI